MQVFVIGHSSREARTIETAMVTAGVAALRFEDVEEAAAELRAGAPADLLFVEVTDTAATAVSTLRQERLDLPVLAYGAAMTPAAAVGALRAGAFDIVTDLADLPALKALLAKWKETEERFVCADPRMRQLLDMARRFAPSEASMLITGESGTGKEVVARFIHRHSRRAAGPFVSLNCAAIPDNLLESELFGHEKGAFTGASARRIGKFEEAQGGTLLLDEVTEMDPRLQAKLLRAIQEREVDRVGGGKPVKVDIRIVATSNRDLEAAVRDGIFREDLYFRLNVVSVEIPALRDRPGDIEPLAVHFARKYATLNGLGAIRLTTGAVARLLGHTWRGNVRELENCMHRAVLLSRGGTIQEDEIILHGSQRKPATATTPAPAPASRFIGQKLEDVERSLILQTLDHTDGNRTHAAATLGISVRTLRNKLRDYALDGLKIAMAA